MLRHLTLTAALLLAAATPAAAAADGTSNTLMFAHSAAAPVQGLSFTAIEFKNTGAFMDYTDDDGVS
jgi:hypothetical protein